MATEPFLSSQRELPRLLIEFNGSIISVPRPIDRTALEDGSTIITVHQGDDMQRNTAYNNVAETTGNTPLIRINKLGPKGGATIYAKCEFYNPLGSVKDRIGRAMIEKAEATGVIDSSTHIIEPTSGNTGIALAFVCAAKGYKLTLAMPESMSLERRALLRSLGASLVLTPREGGMKGAVEEAQRLAEADEKGWIPSQFDNPANPEIHEKTTGPEIWNDLAEDVDAIVAGVGTGGTITGVARYIKARKPEFRAIAVEPEASPVISGKSPGPHRIQGIGAGFIPKNLDVDLVDEVLTVSDDEAFEWARRLSKEEGIAAGISSGANICAAVRVASRPEFQGKKIVTIMCSLSERYLSTPLFQGLRDDA